jgi:environmental stress-induced protein Ves
VTGFRVLPATRHRRMRWVNGGGWTTEIVAEPSSSNWEWRLSVAEVEASCPFSVFPGVERNIALLRGTGFALTVGDGDEQVISTPFETFAFPGDQPTSCRLLEDPVQDINLMTMRTAAPRVLGFVFIPPSSTVELANVEVAVVVEGAARLFGHQLGYLDAIRSQWPPALLRLTSMQSGAVVASVIPATHG